MRCGSVVLTISLGLTLLGGCAGPTERFANQASALGFDASRVEGEGFAHIVFRPATPRPNGGRVLHVYLDGDGTPWEHGGPAADPTPRDSLVLHLMVLDPAPCVYLGRACYHGLAADPRCTRALWTDARYSEVVVPSMAAAARRLLSATGHVEIIWLGYSGGGTLAMLLASRLPETVGVITVAAISTWTAGRICTGTRGSWAHLAPRGSRRSRRGSTNATMRGGATRWCRRASSRAAEYSQRLSGSFRNTTTSVAGWSCGRACSMRPSAPSEAVARSRSGGRRSPCRPGGRCSPPAPGSSGTPACPSGGGGPRRSPDWHSCGPVSRSGSGAWSDRGPRGSGSRSPADCHRIRGPSPR